MLSSSYSMIWKLSWDLQKMEGRNVMTKRAVFVILDGIVYSSEHQINFHYLKRSIVLER